MLDDLEKLDYPTASRWRDQPTWMNSQDPYAVLGVPRPLFPEWGPPPLHVIKRAARKAKQSWHPDHYRLNFNDTDNATASEIARYTWLIMNSTQSSLSDYWDNPDCRKVPPIGPLMPNITDEMTRLGLPYFDPTCAPCTWEDAVKKFGKAFLRGTGAVSDPERVYCPCPVKTTLAHLLHNCRHLPPRGIRRYHPHFTKNNTGLFHQMRTWPIPQALEEPGLVNRVKRKLWDWCHVSINPPKKRLEELIASGWLVDYSTGYGRKCL